MNTSSFRVHRRAIIAERRALSAERGATDPILIIAGIAITLILLVGGSFAIAGFIANAQNMNTQSDMDRVRTVVQARTATEGMVKWSEYEIIFGEGPIIGPSKDAGKLARVVPETAEGVPSLETTISEGTELWVTTRTVTDSTDPRGYRDIWMMFARSVNGTWYVSTSEHTAIYEFGKADNLQLPENLKDGVTLGEDVLSAEVAEGYFFNQIQWNESQMARFKTELGL